jgi:hypothetical protein
LTSANSELVELLPFEDFWFWYVTLCISFGFVILGGASVGWLLTRPMASVVGKISPQNDTNLNWIIGNILVWLFLVVSVILPLMDGQLTWHWLLFLLILVLTGVASAFGGRWGTRVATTKPSQDYRELSRIGSVVSSSIFTASIIGLGLFAPQTTSTPNENALGLGFILSLTAFSFVGFFPYMLLIVPISALLTKLNYFKNTPHLVFVVVSAVCWSLPGIAILGNVIDFGVIGSLLGGMYGAFCGACGGWAIGTLKYDLEVPKAVEKPE